MNAQIATFNENTQRLQQAVQAIRTQLTNLPSSAEQVQSIVRRELVYYRNMLDATMRRVNTVEGNFRVLNEMNTRVFGQLAEIEGHVDDAADMIQVAQQNPRGPQGRPNVGNNAFAGQGHRIRSPTPNPGNRNAQDPAPPARPGGGIGIADHVLGDNRRSDAGDQPQINKVSRLPSVPVGLVGLRLTLMRTDVLSLPLGRERIVEVEELCRCRIGLTLRRGV